jgi:hypothetical protein
MVAEITTFPKGPTREQIERLEVELAQMPQCEIVPVHYFADGLYAREITIPANTCLTGRVHKQEHINVVSKGEITVWTEHGMKRLVAPFTFISQPGTKRAGYTHAETVWTTFHANPTNEENVEKVEELISEAPNEYVQALIAETKRKEIT